MLDRILLCTESNGDKIRAGTGAVFGVLPNRITKKKGRVGERRGEGGGERLES